MKPILIVLLVIAVIVGGVYFIKGSEMFSSGLGAQVNSTGIYGANAYDASISSGDNRIEFTWQGVSNAGAYYVYVSGTGITGVLRDVVPSTVNKYSFVAVPDVKYTFKVCTVSTQACSAPVIAKVPKNAPAAPSSLTVGIYGDVAGKYYDVDGKSLINARVMWKDNTTVERYYQVYRSTDNINWQYYKPVPANVTFFVDRHLQLKKRYYYKVRAVNAKGSSRYSNTASATTPNILQ